MDWTEYRACKQVEPFPRGFRMIAGREERRSFDASRLEDRAVEFVCLQADGAQGLPAFHGFPDVPCPGGLQIRVRFPSCWDGRLDSDDHRGHMTYPTMIDNGPCPGSHPRRLPFMLYETTWDVDGLDTSWMPVGEREFVLSQG